MTALDQATSFFLMVYVLWFDISALVWYSITIYLKLSEKCKLSFHFPTANV